MERLAYPIEEIEETDDELVNDRIPGMPLLGFFTGTLLSLAIWGAVAVLAWGV
jgi:hypothetical protein